MDSSVQTLNKFWGFNSFRPLQKEIVEAVATGKDVLALLPTGGGKSICFQVPGMMLEGIVIVVSPLIALMKDQVANLKGRGIKSEALVSGMHQREIDIVLDNCIYGKIKFLYVSPERLKTDIFLERLQKMNVSFFAIDEAHCISQWGYDFRPPYLEIAEVRKVKPKANVIALTATATPQVREDIIEYLDLKEPEIFIKSFSRANLSYSVRQTENKNEKMVEILEKVPGSAIVYANTRRKTKEIADILNSRGLDAEFYHAGLTVQERTDKQLSWITNKKRIMVATNAFGMGIDKPDVRLVIHMDLPANLEAYYQEAGRAGRDEKKAYAVIVHQPGDPDDLLTRVKQSKPELTFVRKIYQSLANYFQVASGSESLEMYPFNLKEFCGNYNLKPLETSSAISVLESEGLIITSEGYKNPSRVQIIADNETLYRKQVSHSTSDRVVKAMLRLYGAEIFNSYVNMNESDVARISELDFQNVADNLAHLSKHGFIDYIKGNSEPTIGFLGRRYEANKLPLPEKQYKFRVKLELDKAESIIDYVTNNRRCRTQQLLDYFGEISYLPCGICDICVAKREKSLQLNSDQVLEKLTNTAVSIPEFVSQWPQSKHEEVISNIRSLIDGGLIELEGSNLIKRSEN